MTISAGPSPAVTVDMSCWALQDKGELFAGSESQRVGEAVLAELAGLARAVTKPTNLQCLVFQTKGQPLEGSAHHRHPLPCAGHGLRAQACLLCGLPARPANGCPALGMNLHEALPPPSTPCATHLGWAAPQR